MVIRITCILVFAFLGWLFSAIFLTSWLRFFLTGVLSVYVGMISVLCIMGGGIAGNMTYDSRWNDKYKHLRKDEDEIPEHWNEPRRSKNKDL